MTVNWWVISSTNINFCEYPKYELFKARELATCTLRQKIWYSEKPEYSRLLLEEPDIIQKKVSQNFHSGKHGKVNQPW